MSANIDFWLHVANVLMLIAAVAFLFGLLTGLILGRRKKTVTQQWFVPGGWDKDLRVGKPQRIPDGLTPTAESFEELCRFHERAQTWPRVERK